MVVFRGKTFSVVVKGKRAYYKVRIGNRMVAINFAEANRIMDVEESGREMDDKTIEKIMLHSTPMGYRIQVGTLKDNLKTAILDRYPELMFSAGASGRTQQEEISRLIDNVPPDEMYILSKLQPTLFNRIFRYNLGSPDYISDDERLNEVRNLRKRLEDLASGKSGWS